jgi:hypothetical protein
MQCARVRGCNNYWLHRRKPNARSKERPRPRSCSYPIRGLSRRRQLRKIPVNKPLPSSVQLPGIATETDKVRGTPYANSITFTSAPNENPRTQNSKLKTQNPNPPATSTALIYIIMMQSPHIGCLQSIYRLSVRDAGVHSRPDSSTIPARYREIGNHGISKAYC